MFRALPRQLLALNYHLLGGYYLPFKSPVKTAPYRLVSLKFFLLAMLCFSANAPAGDGLPDKPYIYAEGNGEIQRAPDIVTLDFFLNSFDRKLVAATQRVQEKANKVFALLDKEKIAQKDVVAERIRWEAGYENNDNLPPEKRGPKGYVANRAFTVTVRDLNLFPRIVDELLAIGVEEFRSVEAGLSNQDDLNEQVRKKALANAREQAEKTLQPEGMKIDSLFAVSMSASFLQIRSNILQEEDHERTVITGSSSPSAPDPSHLSQYRFSPVSVSQTARVIYLISPAK